ncbi:hypothetical protein EBU91_00915, partial [bacterium]|nr:hypothetical protein [bacterium]
MKFKSILVVAIILSIFQPTVTSANSQPKVESFTFTPNEVELISANTTVAFELVVSHPSGIKNNSTQVNLSGPNGSTLAATLNRNDAPVNPTLTKVTFKGSLVVPQNITA